MKADGSILIDTKILDGGMEKGFELIKDEMSSVGLTAREVGDQIELSFSKMDLSKPLANAVSKVQQLEEQLDAITADYQFSVSEGDDRSAERLAAKRIAIYDRLEAAREKLALEIAAAVQKEAQAEEKAAQRKIKAAEKEAEAKRKAAEKQLNAFTKPISRFNSRLSSLISGALVFNLISAGLRSMTSYFGEALMANDEFSKAVSQLKGALLTAFQPIYEYVAPALLYLVKLLTAAVQAVGRFFAALTGKDYSQMQQNAEALYDQANALDSVGSAAKEAKKQLMGFDEINRLESTEPETSIGGVSAGTSGGASAPSFSMEENPEVEAHLNKILELVASVGAALLTWKISSAFIGDLSTTIGLAAAIGGSVYFVNSFMDAFNNGLDWENLSGMIGSMIPIVVGLGIAFGPVGAAIGLIITSVGLLIVAIKDWIETGELSNEGCVAIVVALTGIGAAISILTGSWIPLLIAGIAAFIFAAVTKGEELKAIFSSVIDWLKGVFQKDWTEIFGEGLGTALNDFFLTCSDILDSIQQVFNGVVDFLQGVFTGNWEQAWEGIKSIVKGAINGVISIINGMIRAVTDKINSLFKLLSFKIDLPGGGKLGWTLPQFKAPQIPYLAQGAVLPANQPFLAMVGDQKHGTNVEAPLSTIEEAVANVLARTGGNGSNQQVVELLQSILEAVLGIELDGETLSSAVHAYDRKKAVSTGGYV